MSLLREVEVDTSGGNIILVVPRGQTSYHVVATTRGGIVSVTVPRTPSTHGPGITARSGGGNISIREQ